MLDAAAADDADDVDDGAMLTMRPENIGFLIVV
jgi:hypothetical protein